MTTLISDIVRRVDKLPKPQRTTDALQPLFEAISNSIHSVQEKFGRGVTKNGEVAVSVQKGRRGINITVTDNGVGLNEKNYKSFLTTDSPAKLEIGGKGIGRLLWLDCFEKIHVVSQYENGTQVWEREFDFSLKQGDEISNESVRRVPDSTTTGMTVEFRGLRKNGYSEKFPARLGHIFRHTTSHFLPTFIGRRPPTITLTCDDESRVYPAEIEGAIHRRLNKPSVSTEKYDRLQIILLECDKVASSDLPGKHFIHFIAHDRTVLSQSIDAKLGIKFFGPDGDRVFHACVMGKYLDRHVNQERTDFTFPEAVIDEVINDVCMPLISTFLDAPLKLHSDEQQGVIKNIVQTYPSVAFGPVTELQRFVPSGELSEDAIFGHLSRQRYRNDEKQRDKINSVLARLKGDKYSPESFAKALREASEAIEQTEQRSLAEYVVRRRVVLDFVEALIQKVRTDTADSSYQREDILHTFICPMRVNRITGTVEVHGSSHDLWIIDERLTFAQYFSSDVAFNELADFYASEDRPDLLLFDRVHGLRQTETATKVLLVEFKRPGRTDYSEGEDPKLQVERYIKRLQGGGELDVRGRPVRLNKDTIFYCYVIADRLGRMEDWTYSWNVTADGRGRIYRADAGFKGSIELIEWDSLLADARERNHAFFDRAGLYSTTVFKA